MKRLLTLTLMLGLAAPALADSDLTPAQVACIDQKVQSTDGVSLGKNHTVFYDNELETYWGEWEQMIKEVGTLNDELSKSGVHLVFEMTPLKSLIYPNLIDSTVNKEAEFFGSKANLRYGQLLSLAKNLGIDSVDLVKPLGSEKVLSSADPNYFLRDIHWTPAGAAVAADALAKVESRFKGSLDFTNYSLGSNYFAAPEVLKKIRLNCGSKNENNQFEQYITLLSNDLAVIPLNIGPLEADQNHYWRWFNGPESAIKLISNSSREVSIELKFISPIENQSLTIKVNNSVVFHMGSIPKDSQINKKISFKIASGTSIVVFNYGKWNHQPNMPVFSGDGRNLAIRFDRLSFNAPNSGETEIINPDPYPKVQAGGILDDTAPPIVLAGSSYGTPELNYAGFLRKSFKSDVLNASVWAGGSFTAMRDYLSGTSFQESKPKLLIWEAPLINALGNNPADIRELQGMVNGPCTQDKALVWKPGTIGPKNGLNITAAPGDQAAYLYVRLNGATSPKIRVDELVGGNLNAQYTIDHGDRSQNRTQFWLRLPPGKATSFNISIPDDRDAPTTQADIAICKSL